MPEVLVPILKTHLAMLEEDRQFAGWKEQGLLFPSTRGTIISGRNLVRSFKNALKRANLPDCRVHDIRHSCGTLLASLNVPLKVIKEILRHTQISTTLIYAHEVSEVNREALNSLGELLKPEVLGGLPVPS